MLLTRCSCSMYLLWARLGHIVGLHSPLHPHIPFLSVLEFDGFSLCGFTSSCTLYLCTICMVLQNLLASTLIFHQMKSFTLWKSVLFWGALITILIFSCLLGDANVNLANHKGESPLMAASQTGSTAAVAELLRAGACS